MERKTVRKPYGRALEFNERKSSFPASLTTRQIEWLRSHDYPQDILRKIIDDAMEKEKKNDLESLEKKLAELFDTWNLLHEASQAQEDDKRREEFRKRIKMAWKKIEVVRKEIEAVEKQ